MADYNAGISVSTYPMTMHNNLHITIPTFTGKTQR